MIVRRLGLAISGVTLAGAGTYVFVYLYRWEWNRALISSALFIAAEVALVGMVLARRLKSIERQVDDLARADRRRVATLLHENAPPPRVTFDWLARPERMSVFVPVLLGAGLILSALAWVVERLARLTAGPVAEHRLAGRLDDLRLPSDGFLAPGRDRLDLLRGPAATAGGGR
jgi:hypothetical protein